MHALALLAERSQPRPDRVEHRIVVHPPVAASARGFVKSDPSL